MPDRWVCLMYHDVSDRLVAATGGPGYFSVSQAAFGAQLDAIRAAGLSGCSVEALLQHGAEGRIAITFDDGDIGQYARAFPALASRGMTATFYVTTGWVGRPGYASWAQLREMRMAGMSIQSHSHSHPFFSELDGTRLREELNASKSALDGRLEQQTTAIALPGGDFPRRGLRGLLAETGYQVVATSQWGTNRPPARLDGPLRWIHRCTVRGDMDAATYRRIIVGDPALARRRRLREAALGALRSTLGPTRYAGLRRRFLDARAR